MRHISKLPIAALLTALSVAACTSVDTDDASSQPVHAGTASVIDGDTLDLHGQRIRLFGIDAPESRQICTRDGAPWRCGQAASMALADKIARRPVSCEELDVDRYGRSVARCFAGGEDLNGWLVGQGLAVAYRQYGQDYVGAEAAARAAGRGIWASDFDMPWDWRRARRG